MLAFPFPDGDGWTTARLVVPPRGERGDPDGPGEPAPFRVTLALELSRLGALRADLALSPSLVSIRVAATLPETAARVGAALDELRARLDDGKRALELSVRVAGDAESALGPPLDIRYLRERHLMDVAG